MSAQIGIATLNKQYDRHAPSVLTPDFIEELERNPGAQRRYKVLQSLPNADEYAQLKRKKYTYPLGSLIDDAFGEFEGLGSEVRDWYDSLPDSFQSGDKGSALDDCANTLENLQSPDVPDFAKELPVYHVPMLAATSRADRRDEAVAILNSCVEAIAKIDLPLTEADLSTLKEFSSELENAASEAEGAEFPGMYD